MPTVKEIYDFLNVLAPFETAEDWDNSGVLVNANKPSDKLLLALDITNETVAEAKEKGCKIIIAHHPVIFSPIKAVDSKSAVYALIQSGISAICAHTNLDIAQDGVCAALAKKLMLKNIVPLEPFGYMGESETEQTEKAFAALCAKELGDGVRLSEIGKNVRKIAVIGGSGADFINEVKAAGADCLVTGDAGHHDALDAKALGLTLIAAGHFETECVVLPPLANALKAKFPGAEIFISAQESPFTTVL